MEAVQLRGDTLWLWCPGCKDLHAVTVSGSGSVQWQWDGNLERPTISPSILVRYDFKDRPSVICHSFVRDGVWEFLPDSTHPMAGQHVPMSGVTPEWPDWL